MKNYRFVASVKIARTEQGKLEFHIPSTMNGQAFEQWRKDNAEAIETTKADLLGDQDTEGDTSAGR